MAIPLEQLLELGPDGMLDHDEEPGIDDLYNKRQTYFEDVNVGDDLPRYVHRYSAPELARWCITMENTHRLHYDIAHAHNHDNLPGHVVSWNVAHEHPLEVAQKLVPAERLVLEGELAGAGDGHRWRDHRPVGQGDRMSKTR